MVTAFTVLMGTNDNEVRRVKAVETTLQIIEALDEREGGRPTNLGSALGLAKSTVHDHLNTLVEHGYVTKEGDLYVLSHKFLSLGEATRGRQKAYRLARAYVEKLAAKTNERAQFIVEENNEGVYLHTAQGEDGVRTDSGVGRRVPLHATAAGKSILSELSTSRVHEILDARGLPQLTSTTITDREDLLAQLKQIHERGYATNDGENTVRLGAIGTPVLAPDDTVIGALSISGPTNRMKNKRKQGDLVDILLGTKNELELEIPYS